MKIEKNFLILLGLFSFFIILFFYNVMLSKDIQTTQTSYEKLFNDITLIQQIDQKYRSKTTNEKQIDILLNTMGKERLVSKKLNATNIEFKLTKLTKSQFDNFLNKLLNDNYKISTLKVKRIDNLLVEIECKVLF